MAHFENLIPFILHYEVSLPKQYLTLPPEKMYARAKEQKQAYAVVAGDSGGPTMCGVTLATYTAYRRRKGIRTTTVADLKAMPYSEWRDILKGMFWDRWKADGIADQSVANMLVDFVWHSGTNGIKIPQRTLKVTADGIVGPATLAAVNAADPKVLFAQLKAARLGFLDGIVRRNPTQAKFLNGWRNRVNAITYGGFRYG